MLIDFQLKYLEQKPRKTCIYHNKQAQLMCHKPNCNKFPYLCLSCSKENLHMHQDKISGFTEAVRDLCIEIQQSCRGDVNGSRLLPVVGETMRQPQTAGDVNDVSAALTKLEVDIINVIREAKEQMRAQIPATDRPRKSGNSSMKYYKNPSILIKKLISESSVEFISRLKRYILQGKQFEQANPQSSLFRQQVELLRSRIDALLTNSINSFQPIIPIVNGNNKPLRVNSNIIQPFQPQLQLIQKKIYSLPVIPLHIYNFRDSMLVCGDKTSYVFNLEQKTAVPLEFTFILASQVTGNEPKKINSHFVALSSSNNLVYYCDNVRSQISLKQQPTAIAAIIFGEAIALLGNSNGEVETIRLQTGESIAKFAQHTSLINCIRVLSDENMFLVSSRDGKLSIYQCETRPNMKISFLGYCQVTMDGLNGFQILKNQIMMYNESGNIKVFDWKSGGLVAESKVIQAPITNMLVLPFPRGYVLLTLSKAEKDLKVWYVLRERGSFRQQRIPYGIKHNNLSYNSMFLWSGTLWLMKEDAPEIHVSDVVFVQ